MPDDDKKPANIMLRDDDAEIFRKTRAEISQKLFGNDKLSQAEFVMWLIQNRKEI